jgi:hypothetical protein
MAVKLPVQPLERISNPLAAFKSPYQKELFELFKAGAVLYVWRNSSPHNWYLEHADDKGVRQVTPVDGDKGSCLDSGWEQVQALLRMAQPLGRSGPVVQSGGRFENGLPQKEGWRFDAAKLEELQRRWDAMGIEYERRRAEPEPATLPDLASLTPTALMLARSLRLAPRRRHAELEKEFAELDSLGILQMDRRGGFSLIPKVEHMRFPRGQSFKIPESF